MQTPTHIPSPVHQHVSSGQWRRTLWTIIATLGLAITAQAAPLDEWHARNSGVTTNLTGITHGGGSFDVGEFVAVGAGGTLLTSVDGANWTPRSSGTTRTLSGVTYAPTANPPRYLAVGEQGTLLTSFDAVNWTAQNSRTTRWLRDVTHGNGRFVAVGDDGYFVHSTDGTNWTELFFSAGYSFRSASYGQDGFGNRLFAFTSINNVHTTTDVTGIWTHNNIPGQYDVAYSFTAQATMDGFVTAGGADCRTCEPCTQIPSLWQRFSLLSGGSFFQLTYSGCHIFYGIANSVGGSDGTNWVAVGSGIASRSLGETYWSTRVASTPRLAAVAHGGLTTGTFVAVGDNGVILQSSASQSLRILQQPQSQSVRLGSNALFSVQAVGNPTVNYQWRSNGLNISGATAADFALTAVQLSHEADYDVVVRDSSGSLTSEVARLSVLIPPAIVLPPLSQSVVVGGSVTFSAQFTGHPPPFTSEWRRLTAPMATNTFVSNERNSFFTLPSVQMSDAASYRLVLKCASSPANGIAAPQFTLTVIADQDSDGLPDVWETTYPDAADPTQDADNDGSTNLEEYRAGTNPTNAVSRLRIGEIVSGPPAMLRFDAISNKTYTVQYAVTLDSNTWRRLSDVIAYATNRTETITDSAPATHRYYRLVTPRQP